MRIGKIGAVHVSSGSSLRPIIIWSLGTDGHEPSGTRLAPTAENSSSSKMRSGLRSTLTLKPASSRALVVVGVT